MGCKIGFHPDIFLNERAHEDNGRCLIFKEFHTFSDIFHCTPEADFVVTCKVSLWQPPVPPLPINWASWQISVFRVKVNVGIPWYIASYRINFIAIRLNSYFDRPWLWAGFRRGLQPDPNPTETDSKRNVFAVTLKTWVFMMPTLPSLVAPVVIRTASGNISDDEVAIMATLGFQWIVYRCLEYWEQSTGHKVDKWGSDLRRNVPKEVLIKWAVGPTSAHRSSLSWMMSQQR